MTSQGMQTKLTIKLPDMGSNDIIEVDWNRGDTVPKIKEKIKKITAIPVDQLKLFVNGKELQNTDLIIPNLKNQTWECKFFGVQLKTKKSPIYIKIHEIGESQYVVKAFRIVNTGYLVNSCGNIIISDFSRSYIIPPSKPYAFDVFYMLPDPSCAKNFILSVYTLSGKYIRPELYEWKADYDPNVMDIPNITHLYTKDVKCYRFPNEEFFDPNRISVAQLSDLSKDTTKHITFRLKPKHLSSVVHDWFSGTQLTDSLYDYCQAFNPDLREKEFVLKNEEKVVIPRNILIMEISTSKEVTLLVYDELSSDDQYSRGN